MERTTTVEVLRMGYDGEEIPHNLLAFTARLNAAAQDIPTEYLERAEIYVEPEWEHGESYPAVMVVYDRPETPDEKAARVKQERADWQWRLDEAQFKVAHCEERLAELEDE